MEMVMAKDFSKLSTTESIEINGGGLGEFASALFGTLLIAWSPAVALIPGAGIFVAAGTASIGSACIAYAYHSS